jgi:hypothetical protein
MFPCGKNEPWMKSNMKEAEIKETTGWEITLCCGLLSS